MQTLTFVRWYTKTAVYRDDELIYFGAASGYNELLTALGYKCRHPYDEVPTHGIPQEFDRDEKGWWKPPSSLPVLRGQFMLWKERQRRERIAALRSELARLEAEEKLL